MKGKGVACARNLQFVLLNYLAKPKTIELKCSGLNGYNFETARPIWTMLNSYEPVKLGLSNGINHGQPELLMIKCQKVGILLEY